LNKAERYERRRYLLGRMMVDGKTEEHVYEAIKLIIEDLDILLGNPDPQETPTKPGRKSSSGIPAAK
jgi:hypothetical protein